MRITLNRGYRELTPDPGDLDGFVFDEAFLRDTGSSRETVVVNLMGWTVLGSEQAQGLLRWMNELDAIISGRIVFFCGGLTAVFLRALAGHLYPVFSSRREMESSVRGEVDLDEKELLWADGE